MSTLTREPEPKTKAEDEQLSLLADIPDLEPRPDPSPEWDGTLPVPYGVIPY